MIPSEELLEQINSTTAPDKDRILRTRALALHLATSINDRASARKLVRTLNMAYLHLQFATLSEYADVKVKCREQCLEAARQLCEAARNDGIGRHDRSQYQNHRISNNNDDIGTGSRGSPASAAE